MVELPLRGEPAADPGLAADDHGNVLLTVHGIGTGPGGGEVAVVMLPDELARLRIEVSELPLQRLEEDESATGGEQAGVDRRRFSYVLPRHVPRVRIVGANRAGVLTLLHRFPRDAHVGE